MLVAKTLSDEQTVARAAVIEQIKAVGHPRSHVRYSAVLENVAGPGHLGRREIIPAVPRLGLAPLRPRKRCDRSARSQPNP